jgi:hypothetical protein
MTFDSQFKVLKDFSPEVIAETARSKMAAASFQLPKFVHKADAEVGSLTTKHGTFIVKATAALPWPLYQTVLKVAFADLVTDTLQIDDNTTRAACLGLDYAKAYDEAVRDREWCSAAFDSTGPKFEVIIRTVVRMSVGSALYWLTCSKMWLEEMDAATEDGLRVLFAKRSQIAHGHAQTAMMLLEHETGIKMEVLEL